MSKNTKAKNKKQYYTLKSQKQQTMRVKETKPRKQTT